MPYSVPLSNNFKCCSKVFKSNEVPFDDVELEVEVEVEVDEAIPSSSLIFQSWR